MKKGRPERGREILFGVNPIHEALKAARRKFYGLTLKSGIKQAGAVAEILEIAGRRGIPVKFEDIDTVARMAGAEGHQGICAQVTEPVYSGLDRVLEAALKSESPTLAILDGVMDPRNLGAIIRSAEAFGVAGVIFPDRRAAQYTPVAAKSSAGAGERARLCRVVNVAETVRTLKDEGWRVVALDGEAANEFAPAPGPLALVLGGEGEGARPLVIKRAGETARIPMQGGVGSVNVSAAAAIAFYLASRR